MFKYQKLEDNPAKPNIIKAGKTKAGIQRYECKSCQQTFTETKVTLFYNPEIKFWKCWPCWQKEIVSAV